MFVASCQALSAMTRKLGLFNLRSELRWFQLKVCFRTWGLMHIKEKDVRYRSRVCCELWSKICTTNSQKPFSWRVSRQGGCSQHDIELLLSYWLKLVDTELLWSLQWLPAGGGLWHWNWDTTLWHIIFIIARGNLTLSLQKTQLPALFKSVVPFFQTLGTHSRITNSPCLQQRNFTVSLSHHSRSPYNLYKKA